LVSTSFFYLEKKIIIFIVIYYATPFFNKFRRLMLKTIREFGTSAILADSLNNISFILENYLLDISF